MFGLVGDCTGLLGDCTGLRGDCTGLRGACTGLSGARWLSLGLLTATRDEGYGPINTGEK